MTPICLEGGVMNYEKEYFTMLSDVSKALIETAESLRKGDDPEWVAAHLKTIGLEIKDKIRGSHEREK